MADPTADPDTVVLDLIGESDGLRIGPFAYGVIERRGKCWLTIESDPLEPDVTTVVDRPTLYAHTDDQGKRLENQALTNGIDISEDERMTIRLAEPFAALVLEPTSSDVSGSSTSDWVEAMERWGNRRPRVERLVSAWNRGICDDPDLARKQDDPLIGASAEPKKRPRTRLTDEEVNAMRTARAEGVSVIALARRFGVHRGAVWARTSPQT